MQYSSVFLVISLLFGFGQAHALDPAVKVRLLANMCNKDAPLPPPEGSDEDDNRIREELGFYRINARLMDAKDDEDDNENEDKKGNCRTVGQCTSEIEELKEEQAYWEKVNGNRPQELQRLLAIQAAFKSTSVTPEAQQELNQYIEKRRSHLQRELEWRQQEIAVRKQSSDVTDDITIPLWTEDVEKLDEQLDGLYNCSPVLKGAMPHCLEDFLEDDLEAKIWVLDRMPGAKSAHSFLDQIRKTEIRRDKIPGPIGQNFANDRAEHLKYDQAVNKKLICRLTPAEALAIAAYAGWGSKSLNAALRGKSELMKRAYSPFTNVLISALGKLSKWQGLVKRGAQGATMGDQQINAIVTYPAFMSTGIARSFIGRTDYTIMSKTGVYIGPLSPNPDEEEVLFPPGATFKVKENMKTEAKDYITLEEL